MSTDLLVNLALADVSQPPVVLPYERARMVPVDRLIAIWCERERAYQTLYDRIVASRPTARELRRPLAIFTDDDLFDISITGVTEYEDQWWMRCTREPGETLDAVRERYTQALAYCPLGQVVFIVGLDPPDLPEEDRIEHLKLCVALARDQQDVSVVGMVWVGETPSALAIGSGDVLEGVLGPPLVKDVERVKWGDPE